MHECNFAEKHRPIQGVEWLTLEQMKERYPDPGTTDQTTAGDAT